MAAAKDTRWPYGRSLEYMAMMLLVIAIVSLATGVPGLKGADQLHTHAARVHNSALFARAFGGMVLLMSTVMFGAAYITSPSSPFEDGLRALAAREKI
jgi:hypothetical protein